MAYAWRILLAVFCMTSMNAQTSAAETAFDAATLPASSTPAADALLAELETAYDAMDVDRFTRLFTDDFEQIDVNRRVDVKGVEKWRDWTVLINGLHQSMHRRHLGRIAQGDLIIVETEWSGRLKPGAAEWNEAPLDYRYRGLIVLTLRGAKIARQVIYADYRTYLEQFRASPRKSRDQNAE